MIIVILEVVGEVMVTIEIVVDEQAEGGVLTYLIFVIFSPHM